MGAPLSTWWLKKQHNNRNVSCPGSPSHSYLPWLIKIIKKEKTIKKLD
jgi:hypothetical protein